MLPPWATPEAARLVASAIHDAEPASGTWDQVTHAALVRIRASAYRAGLYRDAMGAAGVPTAMPFFDRAVVETCLSVLPWERTDPWQPKPLLHAALAGVLPVNLLCRRTKGSYNADIYYGWSACRAQVAGLLSQSRLAGYGLIDLDRLRRDLTAFGSGGLSPAWVTDLIATETWLRDLDRGPAPPRARARPYALRLPDAREDRGHEPVRLGRTVRATPVDDGMTLLDVRRGKLYHVNSAGAVILTALADATDDEAAIGVAVAALTARYAISEGRARADIAALLDRLRDRGLLVRREQAS